MKNNKPDGQREAERLNIERLVEDTLTRIEGLNALAEKEPELLVPIARKRIVWPGFISRKRAFQKENARLMNKIQLGNDFALAGEWQPDSPSTRGALWVYWWGTVMQKRWRLPKLTRRNSRKWFDQAWRCMRSELHIIPEQDRLLAPLGQSAATPAAARAEIKRKIRRRFTQVIRHK